MSKKILIADDEPNIVAAIEFLLQQSGYEVHVPKKSGYEVCTRIRERADWRHIKVVMLSAKGREAEVNKGLSMGADLYVTKPFSTRELVAKIKELLDQDSAPGVA